MAFLFKREDIENYDESKDEDQVPEEPKIYEGRNNMKKIKEVDKEKIEKIWKEMIENSREPKIQKQAKINTFQEAIVLSEKLLAEKEAPEQLILFAGQQQQLDSEGRLTTISKLENLVNDETHLFDPSNEAAAAKQDNIQINTEKASINNHIGKQEAQSSEKQIIEENKQINEEKKQINEEKLTLEKAEAKDVATNSQSDLKRRLKQLRETLERINGKPTKMNALGKSKLDWKYYAKKNKLEKKLEQNRKDGFINKQKFIAIANEKYSSYLKNSKKMKVRDLAIEYL